MAQESAKIFIYYGDEKVKPIVASIEVCDGEEVEDSRVNFNKGAADKWPEEWVNDLVFKVLESHHELPSEFDHSCIIDDSIIYTVNRLP